MQELIVAIAVLLSLIWTVKAISRSIKTFTGKSSSCCGCSSCLMAEQCEKDKLNKHPEREKAKKKEKK